MLVSESSLPSFHMASAGIGGVLCMTTGTHPGIGSHPPSPPHTHTHILISTPAFCWQSPMTSHPRDPAHQLDRSSHLDTLSPPPSL